MRAPTGPLRRVRPPVARVPACAPKAPPARATRTVRACRDLHLIEQDGMDRARRQLTTLRTGPDAAPPTTDQATETPRRATAQLRRSSRGGSGNARRKMASSGGGASISARHRHRRVPYQRYVGSFAQLGRTARPRHRGAGRADRRQARCEEFAASQLEFARAPRKRRPHARHERSGRSRSLPTPT